MQAILDKIIAFEGKLRQTVSSLHIVNERNKVLIEENQKLHKERVRLLDQISVFESRISELGVLEKKDSSEEKEIRVVKEKLRDYISEIDSCIELLQN